MPVQERVFAERSAGPALARGRARAVGGAAEWAVPATCVEGAPIGRSGLAGIHVIGARGIPRPLYVGDQLTGRVVETSEARIVGLSDVGHGESSRGGAGPTEDAGRALETAERLLRRLPGEHRMTPEDRAIWKRTIFWSLAIMAYAAWMVVWVEVLNR